MKIIIAQINVLVGDIEGNATRILDEAAAAEQGGADVIIFPELSLCGYPPEDLLLRPHFYTRCEQAMTTLLAAKLNIVIIVSFPAKENNTVYNRAAVIQHGEIIQTYDKQYLPNYTVFDEKRYFTAGKKTTCLFPLNGIKIALIICEDLWFPEPVEQARKASADLLIVINASPFDRNKAKKREQLLSTRAKAAQLPIIYSNLVGGQDELVFDGGSMVVDAKGNRIIQGAYYQEDLIEVLFDTSVNPIPHPLPPRLSPEQNLYQALVLGVRDYIRKNHFPGAIIGLSGGIDSALTCAIAVDAIGAERIRVVLLPSQYTADMSNEDAIKQAKTLGVRYDVMPIKPAFTSLTATLADVFNGCEPDTTEENIQARIRGTLLMAMSNKFGAIVLTTGNKSEMAVGYSTLYGDMAGGFCVLKDIPKTWVYKLAAYRNTLSEVIPERVITRAPSAELAPNQTDQDSLPPYPILDTILHKYIEEDLDARQIYSDELDQATVDRITRLVDMNEYKRRQAPIGIRTTNRAFGKDRRYPITSGY